MSHTVERIQAFGDASGESAEVVIVVTSVGYLREDLAQQIIVLLEVVTNQLHALQLNRFNFHGRIYRFEAFTAGNAAHLVEVTFTPYRVSDAIVTEGRAASMIEGMLSKASRLWHQHAKSQSLPVMMPTQLARHLFAHLEDPDDYPLAVGS